MTEQTHDMIAEDEPDFSANDEFADEEFEETYRPPRWKRILKRVAIVLGVLVLFLIALGFALFNFGGMWGSVDPTMASQYDSMVAAGQAKPIEGRFVIPIPGCICHSTDPVQTAKHRVYRMSECSRCHNGGETAQDIPLK
jgi:hypothetical protein